MNLAWNGLFFALFVFETWEKDMIGVKTDWDGRDDKTIVGGREAAAPPEDDPVAYVVKPDHFAKVFGRREGKYPESYYRFTGIRYAEPPVGRYRFQRSKKVKLSGDVSGLKYGPPCPQPDPQNPQRIVGSEDCLFLNVFTPKLPDSNLGLPVLFWIHGGGYRRGSASQYGGGYLARRDLVVVTIQYRLGSLGFLSSGAKDLPGNVAMFDISVALKWVEEYIEFFGGNPKNIITFGQGTGASTAVMLGLSNVTQVRVGKIIAMSGSPLSPFAIDNSGQKATHDLARRNKCPEHSDLEKIKCLQQLPLEKIITSDSWVEERTLKAKAVMGMGSILTPGPVVEERSDSRSLPPYLEEKPITSLELNHIPKVPLLTGVTRHETAGAVTHTFKSELIKKLESIPNFLDEVLLKDLFELQKENLYAVVPGLNALKGLTENYLSIRSKSLADGINQVIEATSDALFNFPAYQISQVWSKKTLPAFFYSFDHVGKLRGAEKVLAGSVLVNSAVDSQDGVNAASHGSDLPYIFDLRSLDGTADPTFNESTPLDQADNKVRDLFLNLISQFAKGNDINVSSKKLGTFPNYVSILPDISLGGHFRECQMQLWMGAPKKKMSCPTMDIVTGQLLKSLGKLQTPVNAGDLLKNKTGILGLSF